MNHQQKTSLKWINKARDFLRRIGIPLQLVPSYISDPEGAFFKGCWIQNGKLHYCPSRLQVGEFLHEAGHLALLPKSQWHTLPIGRWEDETLHPPLGQFRYLGDAAVEAWDYAAALAAGIPELCVFQNGFDGNGEAVWESFDTKFHPGFTLLRFLGMSSEWGKCDRWFVGNASIEDTKEEVYRLLDTCSVREVEAIVAGLEAISRDQNREEESLIATPVVVAES